MSKYSEIIGSFVRTGDFPLEADYIFASVDELEEFYEDEINKTTLHNGLLKTVLDDGSGNQALYWVCTNDDGELVFKKLDQGGVSSITWTADENLEEDELGGGTITFNSSSEESSGEFVLDSNSFEVTENTDEDTDEESSTPNLTISVKNVLSDSEKEWIEEQLFSELFTVSISRSASSHVWDGEEYTVTWTLTAKYDGTLVDLDSTPSGWTYSSTGTYTKTSTITSSTGSSVSSGSVSCTYNGNSKTASSVSCTNIVYSYIVYSTDETITEDVFDTIEDDGIRMSSSNSISGDYDLEITEEGVYVFFVISKTSTLNGVTQLGLNYLSTDDTFPYSLTRENYGSYKIYRSSITMSVGTQSITIS